jgi:hypothetical protein
MAVLQSDGVNHTSDLILRRNGTEGLRLTSSTVQLSSINNGPLAGFRNAIINGNFDFWQRGTSQTAAGYGSADRWQNERVGTTCTMSRQPFTLGQTDVPGEPTYFCQMEVTSVAGANNISSLIQTIEGVRTFAGQQITVSFWAKANASKTIAIEFLQNFAAVSGGSASVTGIGSVKKALTTSWQKITHTITVPSISGKTLGSDNSDRLVMFIYFDAGSNFNARTDSLGHQSGTFDIAQVQVEAGPVATPFERRPIGTELALCQRYYEKTFNVDTAPANNLGNGIGEVFFTGPFDGGGFSPNLYAHYLWKTTKRATPIVTFFNCRANVADTFTSYAGAINANTTPVVEFINTNGIGFVIQRANATLAAGALVASAEL